MKIIKRINPIQESISNIGKGGRLNEDVNVPIYGTLPHADAVATEQHIEDRARGLERRQNPTKDALVKELVEQTASPESRTLHYDVVDRKGLAVILTEAKKRGCKFKVGRNDKEGYRYFVDIIPVYGSEGAMKAEDESTTVDAPLTEDLETEFKDYIKWCDDNGRDVKDARSLTDYVDKLKGKPLDEAAYRLPMVDTPEYVNALAKAYKALSKRKTGFAAVYGYRKGSRFVPVDPPVLKDDSDGLRQFTKVLTSKPKGRTDVMVYTIYKDDLDGVKDVLRRKGVLKESLITEGFGGFKDFNELMSVVYEGEPYGADLVEFPGFPRTVDLIDDILDTYPRDMDWNDLSDDEKREIFRSAADEAKHWDGMDVYNSGTRYTDRDNGELVDAIKDAFGVDNTTLREPMDDMNEELQLYTTSLKDFKPAKAAEPLWNEIVEKGRLDDLQFVLEDVFKGKDDEDAQIDIEALNDLLINHPDYIRSVIGLDDAPLEDADYDEAPVGSNEMVFDEDDEQEPVDDDTPVDDEDGDEVDPEDVYEAEPHDGEDDIEPIDYDDIDDEYDDYDERPYRLTPRLTKMRRPDPDEDEEDDDEIDESFDASERKGRECKQKRLALDPDDDLKECDAAPIREGRCDKATDECDVCKDASDEKDDDITESIAKGFIRSNFQEAVDTSAMSDEERKQELARKSLQSLQEDDDTEVIDISDDELTEALGMPSDKDIKDPKCAKCVPPTKDCKEGECTEGKESEECKDTKKELDEGIGQPKPVEQSKPVEAVKKEPKAGEPTKECKDAKAEE